MYSFYVLRINRITHFDDYYESRLEGVERIKVRQAKRGVSVDQMSLTERLYRQPIYGSFSGPTIGGQEE